MFYKWSLSNIAPPPIRALVVEHRQFFLFGLVDRREGLVRSQLDHKHRALAPTSFIYFFRHFLLVSDEFLSILPSEHVWFVEGLVSLLSNHPLSPGNVCKLRLKLVSSCIGSGGDGPAVVFTMKSSEAAVGYRQACSCMANIRNVMQNLPSV